MKNFRMRLIKDLFISIRPYQWSKNLIIFAGLVFSQNLFDLTLFIKVSYAFFLFCLLSSSVYLINDIIDFENDRKQPQKSSRPIAIGKLSKTLALWVAIFLATISLVFSFYLNILFGLMALLYFILMNTYSLILKHFVIIDIITISFGFVLRAIAGGVVISAKFSSWLLICTVLLALFLVIGKRRQELIFLQDKPIEYRHSLSKYSLDLLDWMFAVVTAVTIMAYILYTIWPTTVEKFNSTNLKYTIPFVLYGMFRYLYLVYKKHLYDSPEIILIKDKPLIINIGLWIIAVITIIY